MSVNPEDWDVDFAFACAFAFAFNEKEAVTLARKRILISVWKFFTQITVADENELAEREVFPKTINERVLRQWQQTYLEKLLCLLLCFFYKDKRGKDGNDF